MNNNEIIVFKKTTDNWCGSFELKGSSKEKLVRVRFSQIYTPDWKTECWRIGVFGNDDFGMFKDFLNMHSAWLTFLELLQRECVNIEPVKELGFEIF